MFVVLRQQDNKERLAVYPVQLLPLNELFSKIFIKIINNSYLTSACEAAYRDIKQLVKEETLCKSTRNNCYHSTKEAMLSVYSEK